MKPQSVGQSVTKKKDESKLPVTEEVEIHWPNPDYTCGGGAGRGRILDRPDNLEQIGMAEGDVPEDKSVQPMDRENQAQDVEAPRSQYVSGSAICWGNEVVVENRVVPWKNQDTLIWEQIFHGRCQTALINPPVQRTEQIASSLPTITVFLKKWCRNKPSSGKTFANRF